MTVGDGTRPHRKGRDYSRGTGWRLKRSRRFPVPHLERVNDRELAAKIGNHSLHTPTGYYRHHGDQVQHCRRLVKDPLRTLILAALQIRVKQEVIGVRLVHQTASIFCLRCFCRGHRAEICFDVLRPHAQACIDVPRHVVGVRARWRNLAIVVGGSQRLGRHCRVVAGVNGIVNQAGMVGILGEQRSQHRHCFVFSVQAGVACGLRSQQRQRIKRTRVDIVRILAVEFAHRI